MEKELNIEPITLPGVELKRPVIIAGPCSAETEEQVMNTARQLAANGVKIFRAGVWKPRTRPGAFEGCGSAALPWLRRVKTETGMLIAVEIATAHHVHEAIKYGIDLVWIGARTTANPFAVQEIADALQGTNIPVLVKNPVNPDLELWIGALERLNRAGLRQIGAIHRGFSVYEKSRFRNEPQWQIPIELRRRYPNLPIINDPSHITGNCELVKEVSQEALDLNFDGLIIEAHECPEKAWSDASQQLTPNELKALTDSLIIRNHAIGDRPRTELDDMRQKIDQIDNKLVELLGQRMELSRQIGKYKYENGITVLQARRYDEILRNRRMLAQKANVNSDFVNKIFEEIHEESVETQNIILKELSQR